jgi:selenocysteine lyase/cysteine desulfurase
VAEWRQGSTGFDGWDRSVGDARETWARLHGVPLGEVAIGGNVSAFGGLVAASLPAGARVLAAAEDFTSLLFPFLAQQGRGVAVELVPLERLAEAIDARTDWVAVSAVQSADGRLADLDALTTAARHHGARVFLDSTQASGWLPLDASRFDAVACAGYKWLLGPRGTAYLTLRGEVAERVTPHLAGWYATEEPMATLYGGPLRLAGDARRFDLSPVWHAWVGAAPALRVLERVGLEAIRSHDLALADRFRAGLGLPRGETPIVAIEADAGAEARLEAAGVMAAGRGGRLRFSFHLSTSEADVDRALEALAHG